MKIVQTSGKNIRRKTSKKSERKGRVRLQKTWDMVVADEKKINFNWDKARRATKERTK